MLHNGMDAIHPQTQSLTKDVEPVATGIAIPVDEPANDKRISAVASQPFAPSMERMRLQAYALLLVADLAVIVISFMIAGAARSGNMFLPTAIRQGVGLLPIFAVLALYNRTYSARSLTSAGFGIARVSMAYLLATGLFLLATFYAKNSEDLSRIAFTMGTVLSLIFLMMLRLGFVRHLRKHWGPSAQNTLVIDDDGPTINISNAYKVSARRNGLDIDVDDPGALDRLGRCMENMDRVIVSCPKQKREHWAFFLRAAGIDGEVVSEVAHNLGAIGLVRRENFTSMVVSTRPLAIRQRAIKRLIDFTISASALIVLAPLMMLIALCIKVQDGGSILFKQRRMGRGNRFFNMYKFRSMSEAKSDRDGCVSASRDDDRTTPIGRILRRTSLDELPQLINVLRGDMSLVGPRPHALGSQAGNKLFWEVDARYWHRHSLRPGLTGLAQIRGYRGKTDHEADLSNRLQADLEYIANWSPWGDLYIMIQTARVLVHDKAF